MSTIDKIFGRKSYEIKYRWKVGDTFTGWATYKKFKDKSKFQEELDKLTRKASEFVEYKVA